MTLKDFQKEGVKFLLETQPFLGRVLADEMGLGKTAQAIVSTQSEGESNVLVICPKMLKNNWIREITKWSANKGNFNVVHYNSIFTMIRNAKAGALTDLVKDIDWIILDEIHSYRNPFTKSNRMLSAFLDIVNRTLKTRIIGLTGTPIINSPADPYYILRMINLDVRTKIKEHDYIELWKFRKIINKYMLRRTKAEVIPNAPKIEFIDIPVKTNNTQEIAKKEIRTWNIFKRKVLGTTAKLVNREYLFKTPKTDAVFELIKMHAKRGDKILVFSEWKLPLYKFADEYLEGYKYDFLTGDTPDKEKILERFDNKYYDVLLLTYKTGGEGLNLTKANVVILMDTWWTWASVSQALNRVHRLGQDKKVYVYRLITKNTWDPHVKNVVSRKKSFVDLVFGR